MEHSHNPAPNIEKFLTLSNSIAKRIGGNTPPIVNLETLHRLPPGFISNTQQGGSAMKSIITVSIAGFAIALSAMPSLAGEVTGPRGGTASGNVIVVPNRQGGYTGAGTGTVDGANGGTASGEVQFETDGQGNATYSGSGTATGPEGESADVTTSGSSSYDADSGYSGSNTTTVNDSTFNSTSQDGSTTVTGPDGNSRTFTPGSRRR